MEDLIKKQGVPAGANEDTHERCVKKVKSKGHDKGSAFAICNASGAGMEKGGIGSGRKGHTTNREERHKIASDAIAGSKAGEIYPLDTFMTDALDEEGGLDYMLNNEEEFKQKMVDKYAKNVGTVQPEYVKEAVTYSLNAVKAKLGSNKMKKGGPGSGKKGHKTSGKIEPKHFEPNPNLRDKNKDLDRLTPEQSAERKRKKEEAIKQRRADASRTTDLDQVYGDTGPEDKTKGDNRKLDLAQMRGGVPSMHERKKMKKSIEEEIKELSDTMEKSTMDPIEEIKKAVLELGPEGLKKSLPELDEENKELLNEILEDMAKSHSLDKLSAKGPVEVPVASSKVQEYTTGDDEDEKLVDAAVAEGDNEHKHQGGAHDMAPAEWTGEVIKSLDLRDDDNEEEVLDFLGDIFKAWKMKKDMKKECDMEAPKGAELEKKMYKADEEEMKEKPKKDPALPGLSGDMMDEPPKEDKMKKKMKKAQEALIMEKAKKMAKEKLEKFWGSSLRDKLKGKQKGTGNIKTNIGKLFGG